MAFQRALKEYVGSLDPNYAKENEELFVAFEGSFGNKHVTPRTLMSRFLGNLVCVEGIVTKCKLVVLCDIGLQFVNGLNISDTCLVGLMFSFFEDTYVRTHTHTFVICHHCLLQSRPLLSSCNKSSIFATTRELLGCDFILREKNKS